MSAWPEMRHTRAPRYSRLERLHYRLMGRWPQRVVDRRLDAVFMDRIEIRMETRLLLEAHREP